jgi:hypothetical protein
MIVDLQRQSVRAAEAVRLWLLLPEVLAPLSEPVKRNLMVSNILSAFALLHDDKGIGILSYQLKKSIRALESEPFHRLLAGVSCSVHVISFNFP